MGLEAIEADDARVVVTLDGIPFEVPAYTTVAAAVVRRYGVRATRISVSGQPRTMLCGMGICQECRMTVDGRAHVLACQTMCRHGMAIRTEGSPA
ncbi:(2Fe-2S)-binding protein [Trinickia sp.]|uniref:(2Fe-2S)-binding protein n=1 Tax=Trinickia sp. TaxID=2571163 RepID=UPI003F8025B6